MTVRQHVLRATQRCCLWLGAAAMTYAGVSAAYAQIAHQYRSATFDAGRTEPATVSHVAPAADLREGDVMARLEIPRIGISVMVLHGTEESTLALGAGHVPATPSPGGDGNLVIAAHRDTFFRRLERVRAGDRIRVLTVGRTYVYVVDSTETVDPEDTRVMESRGRQELTLITCYPFYFIGSAPKRFIVHASPLIGRGSSP